MTTTLKLFRRASGTNSQFHLDGKLIDCATEFRAGIGNCYVYETSNAAEARRLQIIHGFKVEARGVLNVDRAQVADLAETKKKLAEKVEKAKKPAPRGRGRKKKPTTEK